MPTRPSLRVAAPIVVLSVVALLGVVMAESHVPVAVPPDLRPAGGAQVATFALG